MRFTSNIVLLKCVLVLLFNTKEASKISLIIFGHWVIFSCYYLKPLVFHPKNWLIWKLKIKSFNISKENSSSLPLTPTVWPPLARVYLVVVRALLRPVDHPRLAVPHSFLLLFTFFFRNISICLSHRFERFFAAIV